MIEPIGRSSGLCGAEEGDVLAGDRDVARGGRAAALVVDDGEAVALAGKPQDGLHEIMAVRAIDPGRAQDHVARIVGRDRALACELARAIDIERGGRVGFDVRRVLLAVEDVVGGNMDERNGVAFGLGGEMCGRLGVDGERSGLVALGAVDVGVGGGVDDGIPWGGGDQLGDRRGISKVAVGARGRNDVGALRKGERLEFPTDLAGATEKEKTHASALFGEAAAARGVVVCIRKRLPPRTVVEIPLHRVGEAGLK